MALNVSLFNNEDREKCHFDVYRQHLAILFATNAGCDPVGLEFLDEESSRKSINMLILLGSADTYSSDACGLCASWPRARYKGMASSICSPFCHPSSAEAHSLSNPRLASARYLWYLVEPSSGILEK